MTARKTRKTRPPEPPARGRRFFRRRARAALLCSSLLLPFAVASALLQSWLPLVFVFGGLAFLAGDRLRLHLGWHRKGGKAAMRKRARYQGPATLAEISRNLSHDRGVLIGTVRRTR